MSVRCRTAAPSSVTATDHSSISAQTHEGSSAGSGRVTDQSTSPETTTAMIQASGNTTRMAPLRRLEAASARATTAVNVHISPTRNNGVSAGLSPSPSAVQMTTALAAQASSAPRAATTDA